MSRTTNRYEFRYVWAWRERLGMPCLGGERVGQRCRVVVRGRGNSAWVEFEDGFSACVSRNGLRRVELEEPA